MMPVLLMPELILITYALTHSYCLILNAYALSDTYARALINTYALTDSHCHIARLRISAETPIIMRVVYSTNLQQCHAESALHDNSAIIVHNVAIEHIAIAGLVRSARFQLPQTLLFQTKPASMGFMLKLMPRFWLPMRRRSSATLMTCRSSRSLTIPRLCLWKNLLPVPHFVQVCDALRLQCGLNTQAVMSTTLLARLHHPPSHRST